jgi:hypothetical protein
MSSSRLAVAVRQWRERGLVWGNCHQRETTTSSILSQRKQKKKKFNQSKQHLSTLTRSKSLHQTTLEGTNLELSDAEQYGDPLLTKRANTLRVGFQNMHFLAVSSKDSQNSQCFNYINQHDYDVYCMAEVGLHWISLFPEDQWAERVDYLHDLQRRDPYLDTTARNSQPTSKENNTEAPELYA